MKNKCLILASSLPSLLNFRGKLLIELSSQGFEINLAAPDFSSYAEEVKKLRDLGYILHEIPMQRTGLNPISDLKVFIQLCKLMRKLQPHLILGYTIKPVIYGTIAAAIKKVPYRYSLITGLGYAFQNIESKSSKTSLLQKCVFYIKSL